MSDGDPLIPCSYLVSLPLYAWEVAIYSYI
jgi:hypothetical protein